MTVTVFPSPRRVGNQNSPRTYAVTETPQVGDVLVVIGAGGYSNFGQPSSVSGCGATWTQAILYVGGASAGWVWRGVGATTTGDVSVTSSSQLRGSEIVILARGLTSDAVATVFADGVVGSPLASPSQDATDGQLVVASFARSASDGVASWDTMTGWTKQSVHDDLHAQTSQAWATPSSSGAFQSGMSATTGDRSTVLVQALLGGAPTDPSGVLDATLPAPVVALSGNYAPPVGADPTGTLAVALPAATVALAGAYTPPPGGGAAIGTLDITLPAPVVDLVGGTYVDPVDITAVVDEFTRGNGRTRVGICRASVTYDPTTPPRPQRPVGIMAQQLPEPTLVDGKPT